MVPMPAASVGLDQVDRLANMKASATTAIRSIDAHRARGPLRTVGPISPSIERARGLTAPSAIDRILRVELTLNTGCCPYEFRPEPPNRGWCQPPRHSGRLELHLPQLQRQSAGHGGAFADRRSHLYRPP